MKDGPTDLRLGQQASVERNFPHYNPDPKIGWHTDAFLVRQTATGPRKIAKDHVPYYGQLPLLPGTPGR